MDNKILCTFTRMSKATLCMCLFSKTFEQTLNAIEESKDTLFAIDSLYSFLVVNDDYSRPIINLNTRCNYFPVEISKGIMEQFLSGSKIATSCERDIILRMAFIRLEDVPHFFFSSSNYFNGNKRMLRKFISDSLKHEDYHRFIRNINLVNCVKI